jgi:hypothetical protein
MWSCAVECISDVPAQLKHSVFTSKRGSLPDLSQPHYLRIDSNPTNILLLSSDCQFYADCVLGLILLLPTLLEVVQIHWIEKWLRWFDGFLASLK